MRIMTRTMIRLLLMLSEYMLNQGVESTSLRPDGRRLDWKFIWQCSVPPKVRQLGWRIAKNALATQENKYHRGMATPSICLICGQEVEDTFHVFIRCQHAQHLWLAMREVWDLPGDELLVHTGKEWLLQLMHIINNEQRARVLMLLWRIWFVHNEITHDKRMPAIESSRRFLISYMQSLLLIKQYPLADLEKGKMVISPRVGRPESYANDGRQEQRKQWMRPERGVLKLNVDGSYALDGSAGAGAILRDHEGVVIFASCWQLQYCSDATESEMAAVELGMMQAMAETPHKILLEIDCAEVVALINEGTPNTSKHASRVQEIREIFRERECVVNKIDRNVNLVSHLLANLGRTKGLTRTWLRQIPVEIADAIAADCISTPS